MSVITVILIILGLVFLYKGSQESSKSTRSMGWIFLVAALGSAMVTYLALSVLN